MTPILPDDRKWFSKQLEAFEQMEEFDDTIIIKHGSYNFTSFSDQDAFLDYLEETDKEDRQYFELLLDDKPQRMFADLDGQNLIVTRAEMYEKLENVVKEAFNELKIKFHSKYVRILNSTGDKISGHWSYLGKYCFKNCNEQKAFWHYVNHLIEIKYPSLCFTTTRLDGKVELKTVIDLSVYTKNRAMRTIYSHKTGSDRVLLPVKFKNGILTNIKRNINAEEYLIYAGNAEKFYELEIPQVDEIKSRLYDQKEIEQMILNNVPNVKIKELRGRMFILINDGVRKCIINGEDNYSDNSYVLWKHDGLYFGCHDAGCSGHPKKICNLGTVIKTSSLVNWDTLRVQAREANTEEKYKQCVRDVIDYMNSKYTVVLDEARIVIMFKKAAGDCDVNEITGKVIQTNKPITKESLKDALASKILKTSYAPPKKPAKKINPFAIWWKSEFRAEADSVVFEPYSPGGNPPNSAKKAYNLWTGYETTLDDCIEVEAATTENSIMLQHILSRVCLNDRACYNWIMGWFATLIQHPEKKLHSSIVLRAKEGAVKGLIIEMITKIIGSKYVFAPLGADEILDGFNSQMSAKKLLFLDELFWGGDKAKSGTLKKLITELYWTIKTKHLPDLSIKNLFGVFICSNEQWVVPAGINARRFAVFEVDNELAGIEHDKLNIIDALVDELRNKDKILALAKTFYTWDLSTFNDRRPPQTSGLQTQKMMSFQKWEKFAYQALNQGYFECDNIEVVFGGNVKKDNIFKAYQKQMNDRHLTSKVFWDNLQAMLGGDFKKTIQIKINGTNARRIKLPKVEDARIAFRLYVGDKNFPFDNNDTSDDEKED